MQSLGRASSSMIFFDCNSFSALTISRAKYVEVLMSLMTTRSTFAPSAVIRWVIKSCVSGRSLCVPLMKSVMAVPTVSST